MDCPVCGERLKEIERSGVTVDICPSCKGVWLDRGEIDKLIQAEGGGQKAASSAQAPAQERDESHERERRDHDGHDGQTPVRKRKSSLLQDLLGGLGGD